MPARATAASTSTSTCRARWAARIGPLSSGGFGLAAALDLHAPQIGRDEALDLMTRAHEICPYSRATRGNIEVTLTVGGTTFERQAA
jgi:organic hydroperoxide reductase OsmC/OhrA